MDKRTTIDDAVGTLFDGMTIGIGGWGSRRKPMAVVRAICRSDVKDLTVVSYGGPDVGLLCAAGKVRQLVYGFVSLDSIPLEPHYRRARQAGDLDVLELDEGMLWWGLYAAALNLPFLPIRAGIGTDLLKVNPALKTIRSPYDDHDEVVAMPPLRLDTAFVHVNRADAAGNGQLLGPDPFFDDLFCRAADQAYVTAEEVVATEALLEKGSVHTLAIQRMWVNGVIEAPGGAHFTQCLPDYGRDEAFQRRYAASAKDPDAWAAFRRAFVDVDDATYQRNVEALR